MKLLTLSENEEVVAHRVGENERLYEIALKYGLSPERLASFNNLESAPRPKSILLAVRGKNRLYVLNVKDDISSVAARFSVSEEELLKINGKGAFFPFSIIEIPQNRTF